ncbi:MAG: arginase family protein, partial [Bdellovibrionales bacterium]|nr:arginase family protein [Bdellovibrionales bacterium]
MQKHSETKTKKWNPNDVPSSDAGIFALPFSRAESRLIINPVPWDVTTSYGAGTSGGPDLVLAASSQIDLFDLDVGRAYECGYFMDPVPERLRSLNKELRAKAEKIRNLGGHNISS